MENKYKCATTIKEIVTYIGDVVDVAFDYETAPDDAYRSEDKAALDPAKSLIVGCSFSVKEHTGIYVPIAHKIGINVDKAAFMEFLRGFLTDKTKQKIAHNLSFESMVSYHAGIVILPPVYDTIAASQMTLKSNTQFRTLGDSGLKLLAGEICH